MLASITNVRIDWPAWEEILRTLTLRAGYNAAIVVAGAALLGLAGGIIGAFALLRKRALVGDALSHAALPGIALAFLLGVAITGLGRSTPLLLTGAAVSGIIGVLTIHALSRWTRLHEDAAIGIVLSVFFGAGTVLLGVIQNQGTGQEGGLKTFIYGQTAAMSIADASLIGAVALLAVVISLVLFKELRLLCFDESFAKAQGWPVHTLDLLVMALVVVVLVVGMQAVGLLLIVAILIIPPAAARFWTDRLSRFILLSGVIGAIGGHLGAAVSALLPRMPAGAVIVLTSGTLFALSWFVAPRRGLLASLFRHARLRIRVARDHLLRAMFELRETGGSESVGARRAIARAGWSPFKGRLVVAWARAQRLVLRHDGHLALSPKGLTLAARVTRNHRLWEQYLTLHADIAPSHVDWSADLVEHVLDADLIAELERALANGHAGELPTVPTSIHPLEGRP